MLDQARAAKAASRTLAMLDEDSKNRALLAMAEALWERRADILEANRLDMADAERNGESAARLDRLRLDERRIADMMEGVRQVASLPDPVGETLESFSRPNGLRIERVRVPLGVIAVIYEARPNVTVDSAALALKTGNAVVLRGGKEALRSNRHLVLALREGLRNTSVPEDAVQFVDRTERDTVDVLIQATGLVDLAIPRGGAGLIQRVKENAHVPVIETGVGNCHVYVDASADLGMAEAIVINAKTQRPSVCNAMETLLIHERIAAQWLPVIARALWERGVEIRGCERTLAHLREAGVAAPQGLLAAATEEDWATEYLALILAVKVVGGVDDAIAHINRYGSQHSECIVAEDGEAAERFLSAVDAAAVYHNASTRFTDGFEFGFGAEIGISTQKLHARGPMGLRELTSYKYVVRGNGQVRR
ncbi:MAG: glutamate-5-semialdehyde dehydrogenase [Alicyclobacillaceae bacterium]|nr:glutamate-5-semialdehyde dehydrogenase [Alicyclobacillaceae bacterium]